MFVLLGTNLSCHTGLSSSREKRVLGWKAESVSTMDAFIRDAS